MGFKEWKKLSEPMVDATVDLAKVGQKTVQETQDQFFEIFNEFINDRES
jgi:hypothetical protein